MRHPEIGEGTPVPTNDEQPDGRMLLQAIRLIDAHVGELAQDIARLDDRVVRLDDRVVRLDDRVGRLEERLTTFDGRLNILDSRFATLDRAVLGNSELLAALAGDLTQHLGSHSHAA